MKTPPGAPMAVISPSSPTGAVGVRFGLSITKPAGSGNWRLQAPLGFHRGRAALRVPLPFPTHDFGVMMRAPSLLMLLTATAFAVACGGRSAPEEPAPEPTTPAPAPTPAPEPVDDSAERERLERERMDREAAERARAVTADLAAMINFDYDQATVRSADQGTLDRKAAILVANPGVRFAFRGTLTSVV